MSKSIIYMACSSDTTRAGISVGLFDRSSGQIEIIQSIDTIKSCDYLNLNPDKSRLYAVVAGAKSEIHAFAIDADSGRLTPINSQPAAGSSACYVYVHESEAYVLMVNYNKDDGAGNIGVFPLGAEGQILPQSDYIELAGHSIRMDRQAESHPHQILVTPDRRYVLVPDLGIDKVMIYQLDEASGKLVAHEPPAIKIPDGAGPRHVAFHPSQPYMYLINELNSTLIAYRYESHSGSFHEIEILSTLPADYVAPAEAPNYPADVNVHPNGRFVYGSNRGHDSLVIYAIHEQTGALTLVGHQSTLGHWPRAFMIDASGEFLINGNQLGDSVSVFKIDENSGLLNHISTLRIDAPMGFRML